MNSISVNDHVFQAMLNMLFDVAVPYVPYTAVPAKSSFAWCHIDVPGVRRTSAHPPPSKEVSQKSVTEVVGALAKVKVCVADESKTRWSVTTILASNSWSCVPEMKF